MTILWIFLIICLIVFGAGLFGLLYVDAPTSLKHISAALSQVSAILSAIVIAVLIAKRKEWI